MRHKTGVYLDRHGRLDDALRLVGALDPDLVKVLLNGATDDVVEVFDLVADLARDPFRRRNDAANSSFGGVGGLDVLDVLVEVFELLPRGPEDGGFGHVERVRVATHAVSSRHLKKIVLY